eukprot:g1769.t1
MRSGVVRSSQRWMAAAMRNGAQYRSASAVAENAHVQPKKIEPAPEAGFSSVNEWYMYVRNAYKGTKPPKREYLTQIIEKCNEKKDLKTAKAVLELYKRKKQSITSEQCHAFISKCCDLGAPEVAFGVLARKRHSPIGPKVVRPESLTMLVNALSSEEKLDDCFALNNVALKMKMRRDKNMFDAIVEACARAGDGDGLKRIFGWESPVAHEWWSESTMESVMSAALDADKKVELKPEIEAFLEQHPALKTEKTLSTLSAWEPPQAEEEEGSETETGEEDGNSKSE